VLTTLVSLASIPSPSFSSFELGPLTLRMYGLFIALGVIAAVTISSKRWESRGGHPDDISTIALWAVPAGVIGARLYHVATDWKKYQDDWGAALNITEGGLGIPGGVALGVLVGIVVVRRRGLPVRPLLDVVAPAIPVAQAVGRLGNWFNQELFGGPTSLPWGLEIDPENRPPGYQGDETFHPTFLYEGLWNLTLAAVLIRLDRQRRLRDGELFGLYVIGYAVGRLWVESLRIDEASLLLGLRVNTWMSIVVATVAVVVMVVNRRRHPNEPPRAWQPAEPAGATAAVATEEPEGSAGV
jgi:prolipoprotein diacylglyceryl transferase